MKKAFLKVFLNISMISLFLGLLCVPAFATGIGITINTSGSNYTFSSNEEGVIGAGTNNPTLTLTAGETYTFTNNGSTDHPFKLTIGDTEYTIGYGTSETITIPTNNTETGNYICTSHDWMTNYVYITPISPVINSINSLTFELDLSEIGGTLQYLINNGNSWTDLGSISDTTISLTLPDRYINTEGFYSSIKFQQINLSGTIL